MARQNIRFEYRCKNCGAPARKPPVKHHRDWAMLEPNEFSGLGSWHCTGSCRGKVKVVRGKAKELQEQKAA